VPVRRKNPVSYHHPCRHRTTYGMSCEEFEQMYTEANGACQICEIPGPYSTHGILVIDHDNAIGFRAVRGLLCATCNTFLGRSGFLNSGLILRYVQNAWHLTHRSGLKAPQVEVPDVPLDQVAGLLAAASEQCRDSSGRPLLRPEERRPLVDAIRIATKAGMRQRDIVLGIGKLWTREAVYNALHVDGCKVVGPIRTRDCDLVAEAQPPSRDWGFQQGFGQGIQFCCFHPTGFGQRRCNATFYADGTWPMVLAAAEAASWRNLLTATRAVHLCDVHAEHDQCVDRCIPPRGTSYSQPALFAA